MLSSAQQIEPIINGQKVLSFCSNDYLGLANHPKVIESFTTAAKNYGVGVGASHLITGHHESHAALEQELAEFHWLRKSFIIFYWLYGQLRSYRLFSIT